MGKLESRNIAKYFTHDGKPLKTLDGIDLNVKDGEFVCIVGQFRIFLKIVCPSY